MAQAAIAPKRGARGIAAAAAAAAEAEDAQKAEELAEELADSRYDEEEDAAGTADVEECEAAVLELNITINEFPSVLESIGVDSAKLPSFLSKRGHTSVATYVRECSKQLASPGSCTYTQPDSRNGKAGTASWMTKTREQECSRQGRVNRTRVRPDLKYPMGEDGNYLDGKAPPTDDTVASRLRIFCELVASIRFELEYDDSGDDENADDGRGAGGRCRRGGYARHSYRPGGSEIEKHGPCNVRARGREREQLRRGEVRH